MRLLFNDALIRRAEHNPTKAIKSEAFSPFIEEPQHPQASSYTFLPMGLGEAMLIQPYVFRDLRGEFIETFHQQQFEEKLGVRFVQDFVSISCQHTLRGIHGDFRTWKLIHCPKGAILAWIVDLNPSSPSYFQSASALINDQNRQLLLVPPGFGNSFFVLSEEAVYSYKKSTYFIPGAEFTLHYLAEGTGMSWPVIPPVLSERDRFAPKTRTAFETELSTRFDLENNPFLKRV